MVLIIGCIQESHKRRRDREHIYHHTLEHTDVWHNPPYLALVKELILKYFVDVFWVKYHLVALTSLLHRHIVKKRLYV